MRRHGVNPDDLVAAEAFVAGQRAVIESILQGVAIGLSFGLIVLMLIKVAS